VSASDPFFVTCAPGLEPILFEEAQALGLRRVAARVGGVEFVGGTPDAWCANLWLRTAIRVLRRVARFEARTEGELYDGAREVAWERFLDPEGTLVVDGRANRSQLDHTQFIEQRVKDAVVDRFRDRTGRRPSVDKSDPDLRINAHVHKDRVTLSVDTSGASLHRRGWRVHQGRAPLAETTAAGLVLGSGWDRRAPLLDPFAGTGTILIEAAWIAGDVAPGLMRRFGFERWPEHDAVGFERAKAEAHARARTPRKLRLLGWDASRERVEQARANAAAAGVADRIVFEVADARDFAPRPGWNAFVVTNPPYGQRVGAGGQRVGADEGDDLALLYRDFGRALRRSCEGYHLSLLSGDPLLRERLGFEGAPRTPLTNGGLRCELLSVERIGAPRPT
jgi:23S rRNA G2445 N2-methylase RlmL